MRHSTMVHSGSVEVYIIHISFLYGLCVFVLHTCVHKMFYVFFHFELIEHYSSSHSCGLLLRCSNMGTSWSSCMIFVRNFPTTTLIRNYFHPNNISFFQGDAFHLPPFVQFLEIILSEWVFHIGLLIFHSRFPLPWKMALSVWVLVKGFSTWNNSFMLNALGIMLSCPGLWINFTSSNTKVSCHLSYFIEAFGWVSKYFKDMFFCKDFGIVHPQVMLPHF